MADGTDEVGLGRAGLAIGLSPVPLAPWYGSDEARRPGLLLGVTGVPPDKAVAHVDAVLDIVARKGAGP